MKGQSPPLGSEPARKLAQTYNAITLGGALALVSMVTVLFYLQFNELRHNQQVRIGTQLKDRRAALDAFLGNAVFYVDQLRNKAQYHLRQENYGAQPQLRHHLRDYENGRYFSIDDLPDDAEQADLGNLFGLGSLDQTLRDGGEAELGMALNLFPLFKATHDALPVIAQSYYQSLNPITAIFPWKTTGDLIKSEPGQTIESLLDRIQDMEFMKLGRQNTNPKRRAYWTSVYMDPAGRGLMVTHGAPVYDGERMLGVVATDITLSAIAPFVDDMGYSGGRMFVANQYDQVLASSDGAQGRIRALGDYLPAGMISALAMLKPGTEVCEAEGYVLTRKHVETANWDVFFLLPKSELDRLSFFGILGYVAIVFGLSAFLLAVYILLQRRFVRPALALTDHIRAEAADGKSHLTDVPLIWRPWFQTVSDTFALKHVTANLPGAVYQLRQEGESKPRLTFVSNAITDMTGVAPAKLMSGEVSWLELFEAADIPALLSAQATSREQLSTFQFECAIHAFDGRRRWVRLSSNPRRDETGVVWEGLILDVTQQKLAEEGLVASEKRLRSILDASLFPLVVSRWADHSLVFINDRALSLFGLNERPEQARSGPKFWVNPDRRSEIIERLKNQGMVENEEAQLMRSDGTPFWVLLSAIQINYESEPCLLFTYADITRRKELEDELKRLATTDPLTGANNRRHFMTLGAREMNRVQRGVNQLSVLMLDIDHFKRINDTYGHPGGDEVLCRIVENITRLIRSMDILGRLGGEEFGVLLPSSDLAMALTIANRLRDSASEMSVPWHGDTIRFTLSIGVATYSGSEANLEELMNRADKALYDAKASGRNRVMTRDRAAEMHTQGADS